MISVEGSFCGDGEKRLIPRNTLKAESMHDSGLAMKRQISGMDAVTPGYAIIRNRNSREGSK